MQIGFAMPPEPLWYISIQATEQYLAANALADCRERWHRSEAQPDRMSRD
jgi:hypothetical protein